MLEVNERDQLQLDGVAAVEEQTSQLRTEVIRTRRKKRRRTWCAPHDSRRREVQRSKKKESRRKARRGAQRKLRATLEGAFLSLCT